MPVTRRKWIILSICFSLIGVIALFLNLAMPLSQQVQDKSDIAEAIGATDVTRPHADIDAPPVQLSPELKQAINRQFSDRGVEPKVRELEGGGYAVDISKRFPHVPVATVDETGAVSVSEFDAPIKNQ